MSKPKRTQRPTATAGAKPGAGGTLRTAARNNTTASVAAVNKVSSSRVSSARPTTTKTANREQARTAYAKSRRRGVQTPWYRTSWFTIGAPILGVVLIVAIFIVIATHNGSSGTAAKPVPSDVLKGVTTVNAQTFATVNTGELPNPLQQITPGVPILRDSAGKPIFLYVGAEYCPYCAAERWSMVLALSRFGTFTNLHIISSADAPEVFPETPTFTFHQSTYTSQYIVFQAVEVQDRQSQPLETMTSAQSALFKKYDAAPYTQTAQSFPFLNFGNQYVAIGAGYLNDVLTGQDWHSIAKLLNTPGSPVTQSIVGNANYLTAAICQLTNNKPANVCTAAPIPAIEKTIGKPAGS